MQDETQTFAKDKRPSESHVFNMSLRGFVTLIVVTTVCVMAYQGKTIEEPLYTLVGMVVGYFFGQQTKPKTQQTTQ